MDRRPGLLASVSLLVALAPFLIPPILVGTDIHKHLLVAWVIAHLNEPALHYRDYFEIAWAPVPTALGDLLLSFFALWLPPLLTEKAYYVALGVMLWWSGGAFLKSLNQHPLAVILFFPLLHDFFFFSAFLPYVASIVVFPALLAVLIKARPGLGKQLLLALLLIVSYGFHLVAGVIACFTVFLFAIDWPARRLRFSELPCILPTMLLLTYYEVSKPPERPIIFYGPIGQIKTFLGHNAWSLSATSSAIFLFLCQALVVSLIFHLYRRAIRDRRLLYLALLLTLFGLAMPFQIGAGAMIGARTLPFALIALVGAIQWTATEAQRAAAFAIVFLMISSTLNTWHEEAVQKDYQVFLAGLPAVKMGSKILPIIEDLSYGGNKYIQPFNSPEDLYNVFRGGINPNVFAMPFAPTGGTLLRAKNPASYTYTSKFASLLAQYQGVSKDYDYIVCWGQLPEVKQQIGKEASVIFQQSLLTVYQGRPSH